MEHKSEGVAMLLAVLLGTIGFCGIGQMYCGRTRRGAFILVIGWAFLAFTSSLLPKALAGTPPTLFDDFVIFCGLVFWTWQIYDARAVCRSAG